MVSGDKDPGTMTVSGVGSLTLQVPLGALHPHSVSHYTGHSEVLPKFYL